MPSDPTSIFFEALRAYLIAVHPRFPIDRLKLHGRDGSKIDLRVQLDLSPASAFTPTPFQEAILEALDGKAMRTQQLGAAVGDKSRLYKPGGLKELRDHGLVDHNDRLGHFRPDAPPPELEG
jgi:hypothetical protein